MKNWIEIHFECGNIIYNENNSQCPNGYFKPFQEVAKTLSSPLRKTPAPFLLPFLSYMSHTISSPLCGLGSTLFKSQIPAGWVSPSFREPFLPRQQRHHTPYEKNKKCYRNNNSPVVFEPRISNWEVIIILAKHW